MNRSFHSMLGHLQRQKSHHYFDLIDHDEDGFIEEEDFEIQAERLADTRDLSDENREVLRAQMLGWWNQLSATADVNDDGRVSRQEWDRFWEAIQASVEEGTEEEQAQMIESLEQAATVTFHTIDTTGNGEVTEEEYTEWLDAWGADGSDEAFDRLDRNDDGHLTEEDLVEATKEFYLSNDADAPGNSLYGLMQ
ncbi:EF-hand domain-containing protein [Salinibacter sp. 10B]|uniref:EF-hand domain-containing protein n=1 Tax=Salinibacter sp. 10B TaxID=1923971 RepID=UPI001C614CAE|nr:EF-hand domain-containing protein [Salinibacter sp. 10B]